MVVGCSDFDVVHDAGRKAVVVERAGLFRSGVASLVLIRWAGVEDFFVVLSNDVAHVVHAAVTNFNSVLVENLVILVRWGEMLV